MINESVVAQIEKFPLVLVYWSDSCTLHTGWHELHKTNNTQADNVGRIFTLGFLIGEDEEFLYIACSVGAAINSGQDPMATDEFVIPRGCVLSMHQMNLRKVSEKLIDVQKEIKA